MTTPSLNLDQIKQLRDQTGASVGDCKVCLDQAGGDLNKAVEFLRKRGAEIAHKKSSRETGEGTIGYYIHSNGKIASLVVLKCESDFVALNPEFVELAKDLAMQVAALNPRYLNPESVPAEVLAKEREIEQEKMAAEHKPPEILEKILNGKLEKFYSVACLTRQPFIKDDKRTITDLMQEKIQKLGENIIIREFIRLEL